jgi:hypothetical protein
MHQKYLYRLHLPLVTAATRYVKLDLQRQLNDIIAACWNQHFLQDMNGRHWTPEHHRFYFDA